MKILRPIDSKKIPGSVSGGVKPKEEYETIWAKALELEVGKSLPIECETRAEAQRVAAALRNRRRPGCGIYVELRSQTVYLTRNRV